MSKTLTIIKKEYHQRIKSKGFLIATILGPVLMAGMILIPGLLVSATTGKQWRISVVDQTGRIFPRLKAALSDTLKGGEHRYLLQEISAKPGQLEATRRNLSDLVMRDVISAYLVIDPEILATGESQLYAKNVGDFTTIGRIEGALSGIVVEMRLDQEGLDAGRIDQLTRRASVTTMRVGQGGEQESGFESVFVETMVFVMVLYMTILLYGVTVMRSVLEEKSSRIVEILLSSTTSTRLMAGKILGVGCVGLTQYLIWIAFGVALSTLGATYLNLHQAVRAIPVSTFGYFLLFYLLGYFLYATLYAGLGAACTTEQDAQHLQFPIIIMLVLPLMLVGAIVKNPDGGLATTLSLIPLFSPMLMFLRINVTTPSGAQILISILLMVGTIVAMIWLVGRVFRVGLLMYGKRPTLPELIRWVAAP